MNKFLLFIAIAVATASNGQQITQSLSQTVQEQSFYVGGSENFFSRAFHLPDYALPEEFSISGVEVGISSAYHASGFAHLKIRLYETTLSYPENFTATSHTGYELLAEGEYDLANQFYTTSASPVNFFPLTATISSDKDLVVEISYQTDDQILFLGMNSFGETAQSYLLAANGGSNAPQPLNSYVVEEQLSLVLNVVGTNLGNAQFNASAVALYPNPANGIVSIRADSLTLEKVAVVDMLGKTVDLSVTNNQIDISNMATGVYVAKITANGKTFSKRLIKVD